MHRHLAARERLDLLGEDVAREDLVAQLGEAGGRAEADPADADHADGFFLGHGAGEATGSVYGSRVERAMASIWRSVSVWSSVFETQ